MKLLISALLLLPVFAFAGNGGGTMMNCGGSNCGIEEYIKFEGMDRGELLIKYAELFKDNKVDFKDFKFRTEEINDVNILKALQESKNTKDWVKISK